MSVARNAMNINFFAWSGQYFSTNRIDFVEKQNPIRRALARACVRVRERKRGREGMCMCVCVCVCVCVRARARVCFVFLSVALLSC